jgi:hypothetical protein
MIALAMFLGWLGICAGFALGITIDFLVTWEESIEH